MGGDVSLKCKRQYIVRETCIHVHVRFLTFICPHTHARTHAHTRTERILSTVRIPSDVYPSAGIPKLSI